MSEQVEQATAAPGEKRNVSPPPVDEWVTPDQLAEEWHLSMSTIYQWRYRGTGPTSYKIGKHVRYKRSDLEAWLVGRASNA